MNKNNLEERLINFAVLIISIAGSLSDTKSSNHLASQLLRSGTSSALNYGEAQSGESRKDFIHKIKIVLKELRESNISLKIIYHAKLFNNEQSIILALREVNELIAIFVKSVETAQKNNNVNKVNLPKS